MISRDTLVTITSVKNIVERVDGWENGIVWLCVTTNWTGSHVFRVYGVPKTDELLLEKEYKRYYVGATMQIRDLHVVPLQLGWLGCIYHGCNLSVGIMRDGLEKWCYPLAYKRIINNTARPTPDMTPEMNAAADLSIWDIVTKGEDHGNHALENSGLFISVYQSNLIGVGNLYECYELVR